MPSRHCCRTCQHCSSSAMDPGWCRLRRLEVHPEVSDLIVCHHWTPRAPQLPRLASVAVDDLDRQLELDRALA